MRKSTGVSSKPSDRVNTGPLKPPRHWSWQTLLCLAAIVFATVVFLPGKSGPYIFDDYSNLIDNTYVKATTLDTATLRQAAYSIEAGPFQRPVSMLSFALNHYWAGSFHDSTPYKLTNIVIHLLNGLLVFWLLRLVFVRLGQRNQLPGDSKPIALWLAAAAAVLWVVHPIQVSTVLYVVQRMTELSALFMLMALVCYLKARQGILDKRPWAVWLLVIGPVVLGTLGMLSKENAAVLPIYILGLELTLYPDTWRGHWKRLSIRAQRIVWLVVGIMAVAALIGAILYALPSYSSRRFTMAERVLTEARVLVFYLSLILIPRIDRFGHQHDDIALSTSLISPWTTLPAIAIHVALLIYALRVRKHQPLIALGILWFYISHVLESTLFALEIAYEHRNYLAILGPILVVVGLIDLARTRLKWNRSLWLIPVIAVAFASITLLRASQWGNFNSFYRYEALHHPDSARIQIGLSIVLEAQGQYAESMQAIRRAVEIEPDEAGYWLQLHLIAARLKLELPKQDQEKLIELLKTGPLSATLVLGLQHTTRCIQTWCMSLQRPLESWANTILARGVNAPHDKSFYYYLAGLSAAAQGKTQNAIEYFHLSYNTDEAYLHPLFALANVYLQLGMLLQAEQVLDELRRANARSRYPRTRELAALQEEVEQMRMAEKASRKALGH